MARISKKKMEAAFDEAGLKYNAGYEAFGRNVKAFVYPVGDTTCEQLKEVMVDVGGHKPVIAHGRAICGVSYFKASNWDE